MIAANVTDQPIVAEMRQSYIDYAMTVISGTRFAGRARRVEAGTSPHPLRDERNGTSCQVRSFARAPRLSATFSQVPPAWHTRPSEIQRLLGRRRTNMSPVSSGRERIKTKRHAASGQKWHRTVVRSDSVATGPLENAGPWYALSLRPLRKTITRKTYVSWGQSC